MVTMHRLYLFMYGEQYNLESSTRMKVLFPFVGDSVGGSQRSTVELYLGLVKQNEITPLFVLHEDHGPLARLLNESGIPYQRLMLTELAGERPSLTHVAISAIRCFLPIRRFLREHEIDVVHGNDLRINLTWSFAARFSHSKFIWHQRTVLSNSLLWNGIRFLTDFFVPISRYVDDSSPSNLITWRRRMILNPFTIEEYDQQKVREELLKSNQIPFDSFIVGYLGRLVERKNIEQLIRAFAAFREKYNKSVLMIVGTGHKGYIDKLRQLASGFGITEQVKFLGFRSDQLRVLSGFDVLVSPNLEEGFGRVLVEGMLQKVPVVAVASGGHLEIIEDGQTGLLYSEDDDQQLVEKLFRIREEEELALSFLNNAFEQAREKYSQAQHAKNILEVYRLSVGE